MAPTMNEAYVPPRIRTVVDRLYELDDSIGCVAAKLITDMARQLSPGHITVCLLTNTAMRDGVAVKLSPNQAVVLHELAGCFPSLASVDAMHRALWGANPTHSANTVRVMINGLRKRLAPLKATIENKSGCGYRLELNPVP